MGNTVTCGPNTALVVSGGRESSIRIGGRAFVIPCLQRVDRLSLELRTLTVKSVNATTLQGVQISVEGIAQVKVSGYHENENKVLSTDINAIRLAAQHFLGSTDEEIERSICLSLEGHQRAILGTLTVESLIGDRQTFATRVRDIAADDMRLMGLEVVSYTISTITDDRDYVRSLGVRQTEIIKREAAEGMAHHENQAKIRQSEEQMAAHLRVNENKNRMAEVDCSTDLLTADFQAKVNAAAATTALAQSIQNAREQAKLYVETAKADAERTQAEHEVERLKIIKERLVLEKTIQARADAELYARRKEAEGIIQIANARAKERELMGKAEADSMSFRALAFREFGEAALLSAALDKLPEVAAAVAAPLAKTEKIVFVGGGDGSGGGGSGPSRLSRDVEKMIAEVPETIKALTGFNVTEALSRYTGNIGGGAEASIAAATSHGDGARKLVPSTGSTSDAKKLSKSSAGPVVRVA
ncbi:hypothetical protein MMPV_001067 [Pyropia vietnamensis]